MAVISYKRDYCYLITMMAMNKRPTLLTWTICLWLLLPHGLVLACGFWGDGDVGMITNDSDVAADGRPLDQLDPVVAKGIAETRLPGNRGFSFVLKDAMQAIPYARAVTSSEFTSINELKASGFVSVIDLLPLSAATRAHQSQSTDARISYFSVPVDTFPPQYKSVLSFAEIVSTSANFPMIVYAGNSTDLAALWAAYRFYTGAERSAAIAEGRELGLGFPAEEEMQWHLLNGKLAILRAGKTGHE